MSFLDSDGPLHLSDVSNEEPRLRTRRGDSDAIPDYDREAAKQSGFRGARRKLYTRVWLRGTVVSLSAVLLVALAGLFATALWLRHSTRASLPQLDGDVRVSGIAASVTVTRDARGVPSIQAQTVDDLLFAQGYITAQDRLWQMDSLRRHAAGELAEILGSRLVDHDRMQRTLRLRETAEQAAATLPKDQLHQLESYARGVNAFVDQNRDRLPVEFQVLHYKPEPWTPTDSLLVLLAMFQDLATDFPAKISREALVAHLPAQLIADLYPTGSWRDRPPTEPPPDLTTPKPEIQEIPLDDTQVKLRNPAVALPQDIAHVAQAFAHTNCEGCRSGSNNWAVAASRSASGFPLVSNDMHLPLSVPDIWYEAGLHSATEENGTALDVVGFTLPGAPFVIVGRNAHVAWSFTNLDADVQDVRIEHTRGWGESMEYQKADGTWAGVVHHRQQIRVRGGRAVPFDGMTTTTLVGTKEIPTPVISPLYPSEHRVLALAWTPYDTANVTAPFLAADSASGGQALLSAFRSFGGPALNLVYADDARHIGYHALGRIPVRGPAQRTSRNLASPSTEENGTPPPDNDEYPGSSPQAFEAPAPEMKGDGAVRLVHAAFVQRRAGRRSRREPESRHTLLPSRPAAKEEAIKPPPAAINYTIGSAISAVPVDSQDPTQQWSGYIPYDELPAVVDPPNGVLATANARITPNDYPYFIANNWTAPYRAERIYKMLEGRSGLTPADMLALQTDVHSEFDLVLAQRLAYAVDHASDAAVQHDGKQLRQAADILRAWDGSVGADSAAAAIVLAFRRVIWPVLLSPQLAAHDHVEPGSRAVKQLVGLYSWGEETVALESLLQHTPARWLPPGTANWNDFLAQTLAHGLDESKAPGNLATWRYGSLHPIEVVHPLFSMSPLFDRVLGYKTGSGSQQTGGDSTTVKAMGAHFGPSERFTADLADADATNGNITTGQSGNPASEWYLDQFWPWLEGTTSILPLHAAAPTHTLRLVPGR